MQLTNNDVKQISFFMLHVDGETFETVFCQPNFSINEIFEVGYKNFPDAKFFEIRAYTNFLDLGVVATKDFNNDN